MPFVTEELWQLSGMRSKMLVHADWPDYTAADLVDDTADREMNWVIRLIEQIRSVRAQMHVPAGLYVPMLQVDLEMWQALIWDRNEALITRLARVDSLTKVDEMPKGTATIAVEGATFGLPLADIIDVSGEKGPTGKDVGQAGQGTGRIARTFT